MSNQYQYNIAERDKYFQLRKEIDERDLEIKRNANAVSALFKTDNAAPWDQKGLIEYRKSSQIKFDKLTNDITDGMIEIQKKGKELKKFRGLIRSHEETLTESSIRKLIVYFAEDDLSEMIREQTEDAEDSVYGVRIPFHFDIICIYIFNLRDSFLIFPLDGV